MKNVRPEGSTVLYVQRLATAFFLQSAEASREFDRCFPGQRDNFDPISKFCPSFTILTKSDRCFPGQRERCSALLMWAEEEVEWFAERLDKQVFNIIVIITIIIILDEQVFNSQSAISVVAACVAFLRRQAERLLSQGLDLLFMLDARLQASVEKVQLKRLAVRGGQKPTGYIWLAILNTSDVCMKGGDGSSGQGS